MRKTNLWILNGLLLAAIVAANALPEAVPHAASPLASLEVPEKMPDWRSRDMREELQTQIRNDDRYSFINNGVARLYGTRNQESLLLLILDAANFHHPKVCFNSSGFEVRELEDFIFGGSDFLFAAKALTATKNDRGFLIVYWMTIDGEVVDWTSQKWKRFWSSLLGKKETGLMMRLDIPITETGLKRAQELAVKFVGDLKQSAPQETKVLLFGD